MTNRKFKKRIKEEINKCDAATNFYNSLVNNPDEIVAWAREEIKAYQDLIKLINKSSKE